MDAGHIGQDVGYFWLDSSVEIPLKHATFHMNMDERSLAHIWHSLQDIHSRVIAMGKSRAIVEFRILKFSLKVNP